MSGLSKKDWDDAVLLAATDSELFAKLFFSKTVRQETPAFHREMDALIDGPDRFVNLQVFRGGAKTTKFRVAMAKRIAYLLSNTIMYVGKSQPHAARNLMWIRRQVERNAIYRDTFQLKPGAKWNDEELQVLVGPEEKPVWVVGIGITGSARGVNIDDYRPDFILVDDVMDEENSSTPEQRQKIYKLVHGALKHSLAPETENPFAKLAILQTPLDPGDISETAFRNPLFKSVRIGCWSRETQDLPITFRRSAWEARWSTETLQAERAAAVANNELSIFSREMECKLIAAESAEFRAEWLQFYGEGYEVEMPPVHQMQIIIAIDPVPPPSDREVEKNLHGKDYEAIAVVGKYQGKIFVLETVYNRGHDPTWTIAEFFRLGYKWNPQRFIVETVAYQKTLVWLLRQAMKTQGKYYVIEEFKDRRSKYDRIKQGIKGVASNKMLYVRADQNEFISQYTAYKDIPHDDVLESVAIASEALQGLLANETAASLTLDESEYEELIYQRGAP